MKGLYWIMYLSFNFKLILTLWLGNYSTTRFSTYSLSLGTVIIIFSTDWQVSCISWLSVWLWMPPSQIWKHPLEFYLCDFSPPVKLEDNSVETSHFLQLHFWQGWESEEGSLWLSKNRKQSLSFQLTSEAIPRNSFWGFPFDPTTNCSCFVLFFISIFWSL